MTNDQEEAELLADQVQQINNNRKQIVDEIVKEALEMVESDQDVIIVAKEGWNIGVLGIVASRLVKKYNRPAIVLNLDKESGSAKGSARSISKFNLFENCLLVKDLFTTFGGHAQAAGLTLPIENITKLSENLNHLINEQLQAEDYNQYWRLINSFIFPKLMRLLLKKLTSSLLSGWGILNLFF